MYVIAVYDVEAKRCPKMMKLCREYLEHIQNSVFEGEITEGDLEKLKARADNVMKKEDSFILFSSRNPKWLHKQIVGKDKRSTDNFL